MKAGLCCSLLLLVGCREPEAKTAEAAAVPPRVRAFTTVAAPAGVLELPGTVTAARRVRLGFKHGGPIASIVVEEGQRVTRGQLLGRLDTSDATAAVRAAQAARDKARRDADRAANLVSGGAVPLHARDDSRSQLEAAEANLAAAREALGRTRLISPVAGTVFARLAEPGETIGPGMPVLVIDSTERLAVRAGASQSQLRRLRADQIGELLLPDGSSLAGRIESLARTPNIEDGLYSVKVLPSAPAPTLLAGDLVKLRFAGPPGAASIQIPLEALVRRRDQDFVFVIEKGAAGARARLRPISRGDVVGTELLVREGLRGGERIVAEGAYFLEDQQPVRVLE